MTISTSSEGQTVPVLSDELIDRLKDLRETDRDAFYALVSELRTRKWPLRAVSEALGVSRSIIAVWSRKGADFELPEIRELAEDVPELPSKVRPMYSTYTLTDEQRDKLYALAREAANVRRFTDQNAPSRLAAAELEDLLHEHRDKGASLSDLADACGVSRRAVAQRLEKRAWQN